MGITKNYVFQQMNSLIVDYFNSCIYIVIKFKCEFSLLAEQEQWINTKTVMFSKQNIFFEIHFVAMIVDFN